MIYHTCPACGEEAAFSPDVAGLPVHCPACRAGITVPRDASDQPTAPKGPSMLPALSALRGWALLAAAFLALTWFLAGTPWLFNGTLLVTVLGAPGWVAALWGMAKGSADGEKTDRKPLGTALLAGLFIFATLGAALAIHLWFPVGRVIVDNGAGRAVRIRLDGADWVAAGRGTGAATATLRAGSYSIEIVDEAGVVDDKFQAAVDSAGPYILNVLGAATYTRGTQDYGDAAFGAGRTEAVVRDKWIKADADFVFEEPPSSISVVSWRGLKSTTASRTYFLRGPPRR